MTPALKDRARRIAARITRRDLSRVGWRVLAVLGALELGYVLTANALLTSGAVRKLAGSADGIQLDYASAYSFIPGRVELRDLSLRVEDYNIQFLLRIERGTVDIALDALARRRLRAVRVRADGVSFRMRHKLHRVGKNGPRLAAYPRIPGFADPPLYVGPPPPEIPDSQYDLWSVELDQVQARVTELWILEYRYRGEAEARGGFWLRPARELHLDPSRLEFKSGRLEVGKSVVAEQLTGSLHCSVPRLEVRARRGLQVFRDVSSRARLRLDGGSLDFSSVYLEPRGPWTLSGPLSVELSGSLEHGAVTPGANVSVRSNAARLGRRDSALQLLGSLAAGLSSRPERLELGLDAKRVLAVRERPTDASPELAELHGTLELLGSDLTRGALRPGALKLSAHAHAPDLAWFNPWLSRERARASGSVAAELRLQRDASCDGKGMLDLDLESLRFDRDDAHVRTHGRALARFDLHGGEHPFAQGAVSARLKSADSLLSLAVAGWLRGVFSTALDLDELSATAAFHWSSQALDMELTEAQSGTLSARGYLRRRAGSQPILALLLTSGLLHAGVASQQGHTRVAPLVSEAWLPTTWQELLANDRPPGAQPTADRDSRD